MTMIVKFRRGGLVDGEPCRWRRLGKVAKKSAVADAKVGDWDECLMSTADPTAFTEANAELSCCIVSRVGVTYFWKERGAVVICTCW